jgi:accessory gene regulator protein AgrB
MSIGHKSPTDLRSEMIFLHSGAEAPKGPRPIVFKEWRDTRTFSNLKSTHCTLLILLIINLVIKKCLCIVSIVQSIKLFTPCGTLKVQREQ